MNPHDLFWEVGLAIAATPELAWLWLGVASYAAASVGAVSTTVGWIRWKQSVPTLLVVGLCAITAAIIVRWMRTDQGPFLTMFEVLLSNLFSLGLVYALVYLWLPALRPSAAVAVPVLLLLGAWALNVSPAQVPLPATFQHTWLWLHVIFGKLFLGPCLIGASVSGLLLLRRTSVGAHWLRTAAPTSLLDAWVWRFMALAFVFQGLMLIAGAVWAHDAWGRYWAWDPLETWAFLTWLGLGAVLHARVTFRLPGPLAWSLVIGVFIFAFLTFFGVPFLSLAPHKGVM